MGETETSHFWVGRVPEHVAASYFAETCGRGGDEPVSAFARDQGATWYDHDRPEYGWGTAGAVRELVAGYSYSDQWAGELDRRAAAAGLAGVNFFVFISRDEVERPRSVRGDGYWLHYLGTIGYRV